MNPVISKYISYEEATHTNTGLPNLPTETEIKNMQAVAQKVFDRVRENFGKPLKVNSFFRCEAVNRAVGGSFSSQHRYGEAIDINGAISGVKNSAIFRYIKDNLEFDQLIWEFGDNNEPTWVHVSYKVTGNRRQVLQAYKENGRTKYKPWRG